MRKNSTLLEMNMNYTNIPEEMKSEIRELLKRNKDRRPVDSNEYTHHSMGFVQNIPKVYSNSEEAEEE